MNFKISRVLVAAMFVVVTACSDDDKPRQLSPEEIAENKRQYEAELEKEKAIKQSIYDASDSKLKEILSECRKLINEYADSRNKGPFSNHMIDIYSADIYQYPAGKHALMTDEQRIEDLRKSKDYISFNTEYAILSTTDSFSGPQKSVDKYECEIGSGPAVTRARRAY
ncbi:hypothetical protein TspCOW1_05270 [Thiohalobacter sp. COW1]|uniref:hypothetical protein n=1 Tax=Thiohalobacter sp. COW1 TaxID=2795687 RepID=UPI0019152334|nr:hypothetical protein [Thiohalobacter sp. COW1]BCO30424.1 hypothetical protein TspCOW1_05270 [Thiohalobacter sp. COW1]